MIAMLLLSIGFQACSSNSAEPTYFSSTANRKDKSESHSQKRIGDLVWRKIECDTVSFGNFQPQVDCDTSYIFQAWAEMETDKLPKLPTWEEYVEPPAPGYHLHQVYRIRK